MAFALAEQRHQHIRPGDLIPAGGLHMDRRPLHHPLEPRGRLRVTRPVGRQARQILIEEFGQITAQAFDVHAAGAQNGRRIGIIKQAQQQMFERGVFMLAFRRQAQRAMERLFESA